MSRDMTKSQFGVSDVEILSRERGYDGFFKLDRLQLRHRKFAGDWSEPLPRELMIRRDAVAVLLYDPKLDVIALVEQFRVGAMRIESGRVADKPVAGGSEQPRRDSPWLFELVAGLIDTDETPAEVARREVHEEAGCEVRALEPMYDFFMSPGGSNEYLHLYCAHADLAAAGGIHGLPEEHEDIRVHVLDCEAAFALLRSNGVSNALTVIALQWLQLHRERLRRLWS